MLRAGRGTNVPHSDGRERHIFATPAVWCAWHGPWKDSTGQWRIRRLCINLRCPGSGVYQFLLQRLGRGVGRVLVMVSLGLPLAGRAADAVHGKPMYAFGAAPAWVERSTPAYEAATPAGELSQGAWYLMLDRQIDVESGGHEVYSHIALKVINDAGVKAQSQFDLDVDPSYQSLVLHSLRVVRGGQVIDQRRRARITSLQQEPELQQHIYNGRYNVDVVLNDVRVGDVIEYEYTVRSRDRLFAGHYASGLSVAWSDPVRWQRVRLRYPEERPLHYRFSAGAEVKPRESSTGGHRVLDFTWQDLKAIRGDADAPRGYRTWPVLALSDLDDWAEVARRVAPLFELATRPRPKLDALVQSLAQAGGTPEQIALAALQYVEENVRYTSLSIGPGSYVPTDPEVVLQRRFGDCKDKSLLLATVLRRLGFDARPALVNAHHGRIMPEVLPTPYAFDHAIVRLALDEASARDGGGRDQAVYWLDPTEDKQYSPLPELMQASFGQALPIDPASHGLETMPRPRPEAQSHEVNLAFDFSKGLEQPAGLEVVTRYRGADADEMRATLARGSAAQRQKDYLNYYARYYPGIRSAGPIEAHDDTRANIIELREHYRLDRAFTRGDDGRPAFRVRSDEMYRFSDALDSSVRSAPLAIDYPEHVHQHIDVRLPQAWDVDEEQVQVDDPAFRYRSAVARHGDHIALDYDYEALDDHVEAAAMGAYAAARAKVDDDLNFRFTPPVAGQAKPAVAAAVAATAAARWPLGWMGLSLLLGVWLGALLQKYAPKSARWLPLPLRERVRIKG